MKIYLAGNIPKGDEEKRTFVNWRELYKQKMRDLSLEFLDPDELNEAKENPEKIFANDCCNIKKCDIALINASERLGVGTSQEMIIAKYFNKPVITILPKNSYHRRNNFVWNGVYIEDWIHPFILAASDLVVEKIEDALNWIEEYIKNPAGKKIKDITIINDAIQKHGL